MPLVKYFIGSDVYDQLTGSGAQSLKCLLPIFDPDGVGQNPFLMIFLNTQKRSLRLCVTPIAIGGSGAALRLCVKIAWLREMRKILPQSTQTLVSFRGYTEILDTSAISASLRDPDSYRGIW